MEWKEIDDKTVIVENPDFAELHKWYERADLFLLGQVASFVLMIVEFMYTSSIHYSFNLNMACFAGSQMCSKEYWKGVREYERRAGKDG